ncbi:MAG: hypothetical protein WA581_13740 [Candidatus Acidiferrales bacterium]
MRDSLKPALEHAQTLALDDLPAFLGEMEQIRVTALARLSTPVVASTPDERVDITTAAKRLGVSTSYLYRNHGRLSFCKPEGRKLLFSARGIEQHIKKSR